MYNAKAIKKAKQKIWLYFIDLIQWKTEELWMREVHRKYKVSPAVLDRNLGNSYYKKEGNKKIVYLNEDRKEELTRFLTENGKSIVKFRDKKLLETMFYTLNEIN